MYYTYKIASLHCRLHWQRNWPRTTATHYKHNQDKETITMKYWMIVALSLCSTAPAFAQDDLATGSLWGDYALDNSSTLYLASAEGDAKASTTSTINKTEKPAYEERYFTANNIHKYLGIGSIAAAAGTLLAPKEENGAHEMLARTAAGLGVAAVVTGLLFHWDDFDLGDGVKDPDNLHVMLTTAGTLGYLAAVSAAPDSGHAGFGGIGAIAMAIGIKMNW